MFILIEFKEFKMIMNNNKISNLKYMEAQIDILQ